MPKVKLTCNYCGHIWDEYVYTQEQVEGLSCAKCKDKNLKVLSEQTNYDTDPFGYEKTEPKQDAYIKRR